MAKIRADDALETPRSSEVGEIDTRAPFQSVKDALSLFRQVTFTKKQPPRLSPSSSSTPHDVGGDVLDKEKETQLLLSEKEMEKVKLSLDVSLKGKAQALSDLESSRQKVADLRAKLEFTKKSKECATSTTQLQYENQQTESTRENYILVTVELAMAKHELVELKKQFSLSVEEKIAKLQRAEEAVCTSIVNSQKIKDMSEEIMEMRDAAEIVKLDAERKKEEIEKINQERIASGETYAVMKREVEQRLEDLKKDCDPELRKAIEELEVISRENERLKEEIKIACELKELNNAMKELCEEQSSYKNLVCSLTMELDGMQRENIILKEKEKERQEVEEEEWEEANRKVEEIKFEAARIRKEAEEMRLHVDELRREASDRHMVMGEAVKQLRIVERAVEKEKAAEKRAVEDMKILTDKQGSLMEDEPDKKIRITLKEYEDLKGKHEESERLVQYKAETVAAQLEEIKESRIQGEKKLEEKMKEMEEVKAAIDGALRKAEIAEEAHCIVDAELRKWKPQEL